MLTATRPHTDAADGRTATLGERLLATAATDPTSVVVIEGEMQLARAALLDAARRIAGGLRERGVAPGDRVVVQLPNWWETVAVAWGVLLAGAVLVPVVPIYRARELRFVLGQVEAAAVIAPLEYRGHRHVETLRSVLDDLGSAAPLITVRGNGNGDGEGEGDGDGDGDGTLDTLLAGRPADPVVSDPDDIAVVLYTSGTTSDPKGVLHSHRTLLAEVEDVVTHCGLTAQDRVFMGSPLSHITGLSYGIILPVDLAASVVLQERWQAEAAVMLIESHRCTFTVSATPFLAGLTAVYSQRGVRSSLRTFVCGGADIPTDLVRRAHSLMGTSVLRTYGSTECPTSTTADPQRDPDLEAEAEGRPTGGNEIAIRPDPSGAPELCVRGPELFLGYLDAALNETAFDVDGFFRTGDLATMDDDGRLRIVGRIKDIINRGGEKFSAAEVEGVLARIDGIRDVAVVAVPDPALVERACACLVVDRAPPDIEELRNAVIAAGLAVQKAPELLLIVDDLPRTPSGKIQRFRLREQAKIADERGQLSRAVRPDSAAGHERTTT